MSNFWQRTLTGIGFVAALLASIYFQQELYTLSLLFLLFTVIGLFEFYRIAGKSEKIAPQFILSIVCGVILYTAFVIYAQFQVAGGFGFYGLAVMMLFVVELFSDRQSPMENVALSVLGNVYVALPFGLLNMMAEFPVYWTFALFITTWVFDTGAYLSGRAFGKHKMAERISPKKTWEGEIGGVALAVVTGIVFSFIIEQEPVWHWLVFAVTVAIAGTLGDLVESRFKREAGFKDSGKALPGHGGILDRFDSSLFAIPLAYFLLEVFSL